MDVQKIFFTGHFAKLCNTTKATLFHYDKLGLLKPRCVRENGYRTYGIEQYFDFEILKILKETGSTLDEIRQIRVNLEEEALIKLLNEKKEILLDERKRLESSENMLTRIISDLKEAREFVPDQFTIMEMEEEALEITPVSADANESLASSIASYANYVNTREISSSALCSPFGVIIDSDISSGGHYKELFYFSSTVSNEMANFRKKSGKYLVSVHKGDFPSHVPWLKKMGLWCRENGFNMA